MRLQLAARHLLQQLCTGLNFARVFAEVQHGAEFTARQFVLFTVRANQRTAVDIKFPAVEFVAVYATTLFTHRTQIHGTGQQVACTNG
ncbi:hypothetical protein D3C72_2018250 [compost metagenome]